MVRFGLGRQHSDYFTNLGAFLLFVPFCTARESGLYAPWLHQMNVPQPASWEPPSILGHAKHLAPQAENFGIIPRAREIMGELGEIWGNLGELWGKWWHLAPAAGITAPWGHYGPLPAREGVGGRRVVALLS